MHVVPDIRALHPEDYILGDVGGVISNPLQVAGHEQGIQSLPHNLGPLVHRLDQLDEGVVAHAVDHIVHFEHSLSEFDLAFNEGLQSSADHRANGSAHAGMSTGNSAAGSSTMSITRSAMFTA